MAEPVPNDILIETRNIKKGYKSADGVFWALKGIDLTVARAGLTILKGRSGSGKTTLVNIVGALDYPTEGGVLYRGKDLTKLSESERDAFRCANVGFVFQSVALVSIMTAYENVEFGLRIAGCTKSEIRGRALETLEMVGLKERINHMAYELSGGEQQRVAIARAIAHKPDLIIADEPTAELDTNTGYAVVKVFKDLIAKEGLTVLMTTHDPGLMEVADCLYELEDGAIV
ncbi:MAG: ABC transporter ATP-binding protein [Defluviitaleaceae bacterium]|nr:ABC transporter ATP-binding protein [Defluviitaleaceae bacterium]